MSGAASCCSTASAPRLSAPDKSCACRDINGRGPKIGDADGHAALHDCAAELYDLCRVALGDNPYDSPRSTSTALRMQLDARARVVEVLNETAHKAALEKLLDACCITRPDRHALICEILAIGQGFLAPEKAP